MTLFTGENETCLLSPLQMFYPDARRAELHIKRRASIQAVNDKQNSQLSSRQGDGL